MRLLLLLCAQDSERKCAFLLANVSSVSCTGLAAPALTSRRVVVNPSRMLTFAQYCWRVLYFAGLDTSRYRSVPKATSLTPHWPELRSLEREKLDGRSRFGNAERAWSSLISPPCGMRL